MKRYLASILALLPILFARAEQIRLDQMQLEHVRQGWGVAQADRSVVSNALSIGGVAFSHGVGTHAPARAVLRLPALKA